MFPSPKQETPSDIMHSDLGRVLLAPSLDQLCLASAVLVLRRNLHKLTMEESWNYRKVVLVKRGLIVKQSYKCIGTVVSLSTCHAQTPAKPCSQTCEPNAVTILMRIHSGSSGSRNRGTRDRGAV